MDKNKRKFQSAKNILMSQLFKKQHEKAAKHIRYEFQDFGYRLAVTLGDMSHKSLYMKLSKTIDRDLLQVALGFAKDYSKVTNKGKLFMWKLSELKNKRGLKKKNEKLKQLELF